MGIFDFLLGAQAPGPQELFDPFGENEFADPAPQFTTTTQPPLAPAGGASAGGVTPRPMLFGPAPTGSSGPQAPPPPPITQGGFFGIPTPGPLNEFFNPGIGALQDAQRANRGLFEPGGPMADVSPQTRDFLLTHPRVLARELSARRASGRAANKPLTRFQKETFRRKDVDISKEDAQHQSRVDLLDDPDGMFRNMSEAKKKALRGSPKVLKEVVEDRIKNPPGARDRKAEAEAKLKEMELASRQETGFKGPEQIASAEAKIRTEYSSLTKPFRDIRDSILRLQASGKIGTGPGDIALIFNYMKLLDPESVVRESEFATAKNTGSIPERIWQRWNELKRGDRLSPPQRKKFIAAAEALFKKQEKQFNKTTKTFKGIANRMKINPLNAVPDFSIVDQVQPGEQANVPGQAPPPAAAIQFLRQNLNNTAISQQFIKKFGEQAFMNATANQGPQQ